MLDFVWDIIRKLCHKLQHAKREIVCEKNVFSAMWKPGDKLACGFS